MRSGFVALVGRPNAGKSTLLNRIAGRKVAIVSDKPQTTRTRILGVKAYPDGQLAFVDTPGIHRPSHRMNVRMVDAALDTMRGADVVALVVDASVPPGRGDRSVLDLVRPLDGPVVLVLSKVDRVAKPALLPLIDHYRRERDFAEIVPVSALDGTNVERLEQLLLALVPEGPALFPDGPAVTTDTAGHVGELIREQVLRATRDELPYSTAVLVDRLEPGGHGVPTAIYSTILVERESQKRIVVGRAGATIRAIGTAAREEIERALRTRVFLDLHVKVRADWREDDRFLDELLPE